MKNSTKVLGSAFLLIIILMTLTLIGTRIYLNKHINTENVMNMEAPGEKAVRTYDNRDFTGIILGGTWTVEIEQASEYKIKIEAPGNYFDRIDLRQEKERLILSHDVKGAFGKEGYSLILQMPSLEYLMIEGAADLEFRGFSGKQLEVNLAGAGRVQGWDSEYESLKVLCAGAGELDFKDCYSRDAHVILSGAGHVLVNMTGGLLSGSISGMGAIEYMGTIMENTVKVSGLGSVEAAE